MKLLIITQVIDTEHPILGFFHRWVEEFAKHSKHVHVICLEAGKHSLPANVTVHSLGKEAGKNKLDYLSRFYQLNWKLRHEYDAVFVHMIPLYVILGAPVWKLFRKKIGLWYTHGSTSLSLKIATLLSNSVFTASVESFKLKSNKVIVTGHGIDTEHFALSTIQKDIDLITVGRITESKNLITLVELLKDIRKQKDVSLTIVGTAVTDSEKAHEALLRAHIESLNLSDVVHFTGKVSQTALPALLQRGKAFVTVATNGSLDKAMLEAMASGLPIVSMAAGSQSLPLGTGQVTTNEAFIQEVLKVIESGNYTHQENSMFVKQNHSLQSLVPKLLQTYA